MAPFKILNYKNEIWINRDHNHVKIDSKYPCKQIATKVLLTMSQQNKISNISFPPTKCIRNQASKFFSKIANFPSTCCLIDYLYLYYVGIFGLTMAKP